MNCTVVDTVGYVDENGFKFERLAILSTPRKSAYLLTEFDVPSPIRIESIGSADLLLFPKSATLKALFCRL